MKEIEEYHHRCIRCGEQFVSNIQKQFFCHNCHPIPEPIRKQSEKAYGRVVA